MMATTSAQHAGDYQQIHDGIIHLLDTARTETVRPQYQRDHDGDVLGNRPTYCPV